MAPLAWLATASLLFYGWWNPANLVLIGSSIGFNFAVGRLIDASRGRARANALLLLGVAANLSLLGYYKYTGFAETIANDLFAAGFDAAQLALPLGISFFTFQQVAFLADAASGRGTRSSFLEYVLFVTFFPQLIAGPIVHHRELVPQFRELPAAVRRSDLEVGVALFAIGMAKKLFIADSLEPFVSPTYSQATQGQVSLLQAWTAGLGYLLQVYFDFSGYSDMALGAGRLFGIRLPANFNSPLKATNIISFWSRWHITLTHFLTAYVFTPVSIAAMRRAARRGTAGGARGGGRSRFRHFGGTLILPTVLTMFLSGVWHGAGYQFVVFGLLHAAYLVVNHAWQRAVPTRIQRSPAYRAWMKPIGCAMTLVAATIAVIFFRAPDVESGLGIATAALGGNGLTLPEGIWVRLGALQGPLGGLGVVPDAASGSWLVKSVLACGACLAIALLCPNSLEITRRYEPATGYAFAERGDDVLPHALRFTLVPNAAGGVLLGIVGALGFLCLNRVSVFLYWQF
jgi:D-alanyl-lipoteichoic acid acyltransferase DltB (MBOAT superfamily)